MVWGAYAGEHLGPVHTFEAGKITDPIYQQTLDEHLLGVMINTDHLYGAPIFMHDSALVHTSWVAQDFLERNNIPTLEWPTYLPDLNPIEHV